jgi:hypothetical protein
VTGEYRRWRAVGVLSAVLLLMLGAGQTWRLVAQQAGTVSYVYQDRITALELNIDAGTTRIVPSPDGRVLVGTTSSWTLAQPEIHRELSGTVLRIDSRCPGVVLPIVSPGCSTDFNIAVPPDTAVTVKGGSSDTTVRGISGDLTLRADSGSFELSDVSGRISAEMTSGSVTGSGITSQVVRADVTSGSANLTFTLPPQTLAMAADSGSVQAVLPRGTGYQLAVSVGSGGRDVDSALADPASHRTITASANSGAVVLQVGG